MLDLRPCCENCNIDLPFDSEEAMICSFECTFCLPCTRELLKGICPNCGGELVKRPIRPGSKMTINPAQSLRLFKPVDLEAHKVRIAALQSLSSALR